MTIMGKPMDMNLGPDYWRKYRVVKDLKSKGWLPFFCVVTDRDLWFPTQQALDAYEAFTLKGGPVPPEEGVVI